MWELAKSVLTSQSPWSGLVYLIVGAILGAVISGYLAVRAQRPKLVITGGGSGGNNERQQWSVSITNRPAFFGVRFNGETAQDLQAWIRLKERSESHFHHLRWTGTAESGATLEAGQTRALELFSWFSERRGSYFILDRSGDPVAQFEAPELAFVLRINDRLGRASEFSFRVRFDNSHLKQPPQLQLVHPISLERRVLMLRMALRQFRSAVRLRA